MSIIEEALKKIQKQRSAGQQGSAYVPPLPQLSGSSSGGGEGKRRLYFIAFAGSITALGVTLWLGLDYLQKEQRAKARMMASQSTAPLPAAPVAPAPSEPQPAPEIAAQEAPAADLQPVEQAPLRESPFTPPPSSPAMAPEKVLPQQQVQAKPAPATVAAPAPQTKADGWLDEGWAVANGGNFGEALNIWEAGLRALPKNRFVFVVASYTNEEAVQKKLRETGKDLGAFAVKSAFGGAPAYYLMALPPEGEDIKTPQAAISKKLRLETVKGNSAKLIVNKLDGAKAAMGKKTASGATQGSVKSEAKGKTAKPSPAAPNPLLDDRIAKAKRLLAAGAYDSVVETMQPLFASNVDAWEPYLITGTAYLGLGMLDAAKNYLDQGLSHHPAQPKLLVQRAIVEQQKNNNETALKFLKEAEVADPSMPEIWFNTAYSNDALGRAEVARKAYSRFLALTEKGTGYLKQRKEALKRLEVISR